MKGAGTGGKKGKGTLKPLGEGEGKGMDRGRDKRKSKPEGDSEDAVDVIPAFFTTPV